MDFRIVARLLGALIAAISASMTLPLIWAFIDGDRSSITAFLMSMGAGAALALVLYIWGGRVEGDLRRKEGLAMVSLGWILASAIGALPFIFSGTLPNYIDAYFEAMSGFTTTGSTVMAVIEGKPRAILFWRDFTQWLGGMGIIVLFIAVLPQLGIGARHLYRSEIPGTIKEGIRPRIQDTASMLWKIYIVLSAAETALLMLGGMDLFEALCHMFGTMATGGFSTRNMSIGAYNSIYIEGVIIFFMVLAGTNFSLYFSVARGRPMDMFKNAEWNYYLLIMACATILITISLMGAGTYSSPAENLRHAAFQTVSITTTTGYATADFNVWPTFCRLLLVTLMFVGGCSGSTGGSMKVMRWVVLAKIGGREITKIFHPQAVRSIRVGGQNLKSETIDSITGFTVLFLGIFLAASLVMAMLGLDIVTATTSVAATLCNIGPGLAGVGVIENYSHIPQLGKMVLSLCMLFGRLEVYTVLVLFVPAFWRN